MALHRIRQGLDLPITGQPEQTVHDGAQVSRVAVLASDFVGMKPTMHVREGDSVRRGQLLFEDKKTPGVRYTSPGDGRIAAINRGDRRALQSVVVELGSADQGGRGSDVSLRSFSAKHPGSMTGDEVRELLLESGQWVALRRRPFSRVPPADEVPRSIFVTAVDSHPLAADPAKVLEGRHGDFERGLVALGKLTTGPVYVCTAPGVELPLPSGGDFRREEFSGRHPAGTAGLHIHRLDPAGRDRTVWWIGYQEVAATGKLLETGQTDVGRVVALAGPGARRPRLLRTRIGASLDDLTAGELEEGDQRVISGSPIFGRTAEGPILGYLGRHAHQVTVLPEGRRREFLGWLALGLDKYSVLPTFASKLVPGKRFAFTTSKNGSDRAIVPIGMYEKVFPLDLPISFLLRALAMQDLERAEMLGALELDEEDLALCSFVCPGKHDYGLYLRELLTTVEKEG